jgi:protein tyrosine phosphatase (PTP) superfamily phosphohydrolase (DUF442 family)
LKSSTLLLVPGLACTLGSCGVSPALQGRRPAEWAAPVQLAGVPNLYRLSPNVYRSAQPTADGMKNLQAMGIKTVVNLRYFHSDDEAISHTGLRSVSMPNLTWSPDPRHVEPLMRLLADPRQGPVLIHCQHGSDRTGSMCALYRIRIQHWTPEAALWEMTAGGYGYHPVWHNLPGWVRSNGSSGSRAGI